jgi:hypothetical protein
MFYLASVSPKTHKTKYMLNAEGEPYPFANPNEAIGFIRNSFKPRMSLAGTVNYMKDNNIFIEEKED